MVRDGEVREATTLGVCWNLIGHEGNISSVAAGLLVNKAAARKITRRKISEHNNQINNRGLYDIFNYISIS